MKKMLYDDQDLALSIFKSLNTSSTKIDVIESILRSIKKKSNIEAVGIRLRDGEDFPYYTTVGFPENFVEAERYLCSRDSSANIIRDDNGSPVLECMCGNVICGRTDPRYSFFTNNGSFFSNCTTKLLARTTDKERQSHTRNRCNGEGYESVALIPLNDENETIGLLQLNDKRKDMFRNEDIYFFEKLGESIGVAVTKKKNEELLHAMNTQLELKVKDRTSELEKSLAEKNLLLQEVHHRVKNNLYTIVSFLNLQAMNAKSIVVKNALIDAAMRVQSIGTIHQKLYKADEYLEIDIENYLHDLLSEIYRSYHVDFSNVMYSIICEKIFMNIDTAIPCGLILNEIIVNSLKHAFPNGMKGLIEVSIRFIDDRYHLQIKDNGVGFFKENDMANSETLGMLIIHNLVKQLDGSIKVDCDTGVSYHITFNKVLKEELRWKKNES